MSYEVSNNNNNLTVNANDENYTNNDPFNKFPSVMDEDQPIPSDVGIYNNTNTGDIDGHNQLIHQQRQLREEEVVFGVIDDHQSTGYGSYVSGSFESVDSVHIGSHSLFNHDDAGSSPHHNHIENNVNENNINNNIYNNHNHNIPNSQIPMFQAHNHNNQSFTSYPHQLPLQQPHIPQQWQYPHPHDQPQQPLNVNHASASNTAYLQSDANSQVQINRSMSNETGSFFYDNDNNNIMTSSTSHTLPSQPQVEPDDDININAYKSFYDDRINGSDNEFMPLYDLARGQSIDPPFPNFADSNNSNNYHMLPVSSSPDPQLPQYPIPSPLTTTRALPMVNMPQLPRLPLHELHQNQTSPYLHRQQPVQQELPTPNNNRLYTDTAEYETEHEEAAPIKLEVARHGAHHNDSHLIPPPLHSDCQSTSYVLPPWMPRPAAEPHVTVSPNFISPAIETKPSFKSAFAQNETTEYNNYLNHENHCNYNHEQQFYFPSSSETETNANNNTNVNVNDKITTVGVGRRFNSKLKEEAESESDVEKVGPREGKGRGRVKYNKYSTKKQVKAVRKYEYDDDEDEDYDLEDDDIIMTRSKSKATSTSTKNGRKYNRTKPKTKKSKSKSPKSRRGKKRGVDAIKDESEKSPSPKKRKYNRTKSKKNSKKKSQSKPKPKPAAVKTECTLTNKQLDQWITDNIDPKVCKKLFKQHEKNGTVTTREGCHQCHIDGCGKKYGSRCHLRRHVDEIHTGKKFVCKWGQCHSKFKQKSQAREHIRNSHLSDTPKWHCFICNEDFTRWGGVKRHLEEGRCDYLKGKKGDFTQAQIDAIKNDTHLDLNKGQCRGPAVVVDDEI